MTQVLPDHESKQIEDCLVRPLVALPCSDPLGATIVLKLGGDALWLGSLECSTMRGVPDQYVLNATDMSLSILDIQRVTRNRIPLLVDVDAGYGGMAAVEDTFIRLSLLRAAMAVMENKRPGIDKLNSLAPSGNSLTDILPPKEYSHRIAAAREAARSVGDTWVCARFEDLAVGRSIAETLDSIEIVMSAGPDAIFVSCKDNEPNRLFKVLKACRNSYPHIPIITTTGRYEASLPNRLFFEVGVNILVYSHHAARGKIRALENIYTALLESGDQDRDIFCSVDEIIDMNQKCGSNPVQANLSGNPMGQNVQRQDAAGDSFVGTRMFCGNNEGQEQG
jgi:2-methylisocitrate lyase-like PEP mutase family enzyme